MTLQLKELELTSRSNDYEINNQVYKINESECCISYLQRISDINIAYKKYIYIYIKLYKRNSLWDT